MSSSLSNSRQIHLEQLRAHKRPAEKLWFAFVWTATAAAILRKLTKCKETSETDTRL